MHDRKARVQWLDIPEGRRILVISDIHGNMEYFRGVLELAGFGDDDELIIDGDFLEKGPDSLGVLRCIMELCKKGKKVHRRKISGGHNVLSRQSLRSQLQLFLQNV